MSLLMLRFNKIKINLIIQRKYWFRWTSTLQKLWRVYSVHPWQKPCRPQIWHLRPNTLFRGTVNLFKIYRPGWITVSLITTLLFRTLFLIILVVTIMCRYCLVTRNIYIYSYGMWHYMAVYINNVKYKIFNLIFNQWSFSLFSLLPPEGQDRARCAYLAAVFVTMRAIVIWLWTGFRAWVVPVRLGWILQPRPCPWRNVVWRQERHGTFQRRAHRHLGVRMTIDKRYIDNINIFV